jgi:hypothetical protein
VSTVVPNIGLQRAAKVIADDITHIAVGSNATAHIVGNTTLGTETNRLAPTNRLYNNNESQIRSFFPNDNLPTTVEEIGAFMNGTGSADSGSALVLHNLTFSKGTQDLYLVAKLQVNRP